MKKAVVSILMVLVMTIPIVSATETGKESVEGQHGWFGVQYDTKYNATQDPINIVTVVNRTELGFKLNSKNIIVQRKTSTFGWYYPIGDTSSDDSYYYVDDIGDYRTVVHFKSNASDVRITVFPDSFLGHAEKFIYSSVVSVKKLLIDLANWKWRK